MRVLLATAMLIGSMLALNQAADAGRKHKRSVKPFCYLAQPRHFRGSSPGCARGAWGYNPFDPTGEFRGFPGWARKAFSEGRR
jgi:hypothetical protein